MHENRSKLEANEKHVINNIYILATSMNMVEKVCYHHGFGFVLLETTTEISYIYPIHLLQKSILCSG